MLFSSCNHNESGAPFRGDSFEVIVSKLSRTMLSCEQKPTLRMQHSELVIVRAFQVEK